MLFDPKSNDDAVLFAGIPGTIVWERAALSLILGATPINDQLPAASLSVIRVPKTRQRLEQPSYGGRGSVRQASVKRTLRKDPSDHLGRYVYARASHETADRAMADRTAC